VAAATRRICSRWPRTATLSVGVWAWWTSWVVPTQPPHRRRVLRRGQQPAASSSATYSTASSSSSSSKQRSSSRRGSCSLQPATPLNRRHQLPAAPHPSLHIGAMPDGGRLCLAAVYVSSAVTIALWSYAVFLGASRGLNFLHDTNWSLQAPVGSPAYKAQNAARQFLVQKSAQYEFSQGVLVVAQDPATYPVTHKTVRDLTQRMLDATLARCDSDISRIDHRFGGPVCWWRDMHGVFAPDGNALAPNRTVGASRTFESLDVDVSGLISPDNRTATLVVWSTNAGFGVAGNRWQVEAWRRLQDSIDAWLAAASTPSGDPHRATNGALYTVGLTHEQMLLDAGQKGVIKDFEHGDMITLPIAWGILLLVCGPSAALVLVTLPVTALVSFWVLDQVATGRWFASDSQITHANPYGTPRVAFPSFTPAIFINEIIAISLDYGLFMLTRYGEELRRGKSNIQAVTIALSKAGRVVFVSGVTLGLTNAGLTFCSVDVVAAIGWGGAICCAISVVVHITLLPALLILSGPCCRSLANYRCTVQTAVAMLQKCDSTYRCRVCSSQKRREPTQLTALIPFDQTWGSSREASPPYSGWIRLGLWCRDYRACVISTMLVALAPLCYFVCVKAHITADGAMLTPHETPALLTLRDIGDHGIHAGVLHPVVPMAMRCGVVLWRLCPSCCC
jgi:hypothetical protein